MRGWIVPGFLLVAMCLIGSGALADEVKPRVTGVSLISDGDGATRVLFKADESFDLTRVAILRAGLKVGTAGPGEDRRIRLRVHPVTTAWTPGAVDWTAGWSRPGGDFDDEVYTEVELDLSRGTSEARFDLTGVVKEILEGDLVADGFILTVAPRDGIGLRTEDVARLGGLASASLEIKYRNVSPRPDRRGGRG